jgi:hypothetical protein
LTTEEAMATKRCEYVHCVIRAAGSLPAGIAGMGSPPAPVRTITHHDLCAVVSSVTMSIPEPTRENLLAHERVNQRVMKDHAILPMSFGTVLQRPADVKALLRLARAPFRDALDKLEGKVEYGIKVLCEQAPLVREAAHVAAAVRTALEKVAVSIHVEAEADDDVILSASCLVRRENVARLDRTVKALATRHGNLTFR